MTEDIFKKNKKKISSANEAFDAFYGSMDEMFRKKEVDSFEVEVLTGIKDVVDYLAPVNDREKYKSWSPDVLTRADFKLASLMMSLATIASEKAGRANAMMRYAKFRKFSEWNPIKTRLEKQLKEGKRLIKEDIESEVMKEIFAENMMEAMMITHADLLQMIFDSTRSVLSSLAHRINMQKQEMPISRKQS